MTPIAHQYQICVDTSEISCWWWLEHLRKMKLTTAVDWWIAENGYTYINVLFNSEADVALFALVYPAQFNNLEQVT